MGRISAGVLLLFATSCAAVRATPPSTAATTACAFGDLQGCTALCERGSAVSCDTAGAHFELGSGVPRDVDAAARYYTRACDAGADAGCENAYRVRAAKIAAPIETSRVEPPSSASRTPDAIDRDPKPDASGYGTFASTGGMLGTWNTTASSCSSGASQTPGGVLSWAAFGEAAYEHSLTIRAKDSEVFGIGVGRQRPYRSAEILRQQCSRFDVGLHPHTDGSMAVDVELDCGTTDGGRVTASIHRAACGGG
jgi:hypothetical protein